MKGVYLLVIAFACGCKYAQVPCTVRVGSWKVPSVAITIPYEEDYHSEIRWFGKGSPWNNELRSSDNGYIWPFGSVCALMPERRINGKVQIHLTKLGYELIWEGRNVRSYFAHDKSLPVAYKLMIERNDGSGKLMFRYETITLNDAIRGVAGDKEQFIVFTKDGVLIKRMNELRFSYIQRPLKVLRSRENNRRVSPTKEEQEVLDYIDRHAYEIDRLLEQLEQDNEGIGQE